LEECGPCPVFASFTLVFALQLRKKHGKTTVRVRKTSVRVRKIITIRKLEFMWLLYSGDLCGKVMELCVEMNLRNVPNFITTFLLWNVLQQDGGLYLNN